MPYDELHTLACGLQGAPVIQTRAVDAGKGKNIAQLADQGLVGLSGRAAVAVKIAEKATMDSVDRVVEPERYQLFPQIGFQPADVGPDLLDRCG